MDWPTLADVKEWIRGEDQRVTDDDVIQRALDTAIVSVRSWCGRDFTPAGDTATVRQFVATGCTVLWIDDAAAVTSPDGRPEPLNGVVDGVDGWPFTRIVGDFTTGDVVDVTARWGWADTPVAVCQAVLEVAHTLVEHRNAPLGIAGMTEFGAARVPVDVMRSVGGYLHPYRRVDRMGAIG